MKKIIAVLFLLFASAEVSKAQDYSWALGLRGGVVSSGLTAKFSLDGTNAIESILSFSNGVSLYELYERHMPVIAPQFKLYYGGGINVGAWNYKIDENRRKSKFTAGLNAIVGLEYKVDSAPLAISVDYTPGFNFVGYTASSRTWANFGVGVKIVF